MKKLITSILILAGCTSFLKSQGPATLTPVSDVLHYYYNKEFFKNGASHLTFNYTKVGASIISNTLVTFVGSIFENKDPNLVIRGVYGLGVMKDGPSSQISCKVKYYLTALDANRMPKFPAVDSVVVIYQKHSKLIAPTANYIPTYTPTMRGDTFPAPHVMGSDFAIVARNWSTTSGDTMLFYRTSGMTYTAWPNVPWQKKYSDGNGVIRYNKTWLATTNYTGTTFGKGTDYEYMFAPIVNYTLSAEHELPIKISDTTNYLCVGDVHTYTNKSSFQYTHRMYNMLELVRKWTNNSPLYTVPLTGNWTSDSSIVWNFLDDDDGIKDTRKVLPLGVNTIQHGIADKGYFNGCEFRAVLKPMGLEGVSALIGTSDRFAFRSYFCNGDTTGIHKNYYQNNKIKLYPNPSADGKYVISNMEGTNSVRVFNILGQEVFNEKVVADTFTMDLSKQHNGSYFVRIESSTGQGRSIIIIKQN